MKKFFKKTDGFTLVELIVVIAILGILAGVGTVGYSGYVKKANMAADQQLVSSVRNALELGYYSNQLTEGGYVVLTTNKNAAAGNDNTTTVMDAAFSDGWEGVLRLKYDGWGIGTQFDSEALESVKESMFKEEVLGYLLNDVQIVVGALGNFLEGNDVPDVVQKYMNNLGLQTGATVDANNKNMVSNMATMYVADYIADPNNIAEGKDFVQTWGGNMVADMIESMNSNGAPMGDSGNMQNVLPGDALAAGASAYARIEALANFANGALGEQKYVLPKDSSEFASVNDYRTLLSKIEQTERAIMTQDFDLYCSYYGITNPNGVIPKTGDSMENMKDYVVPAAGTVTQASKDAKAFLTYMGGLSESAPTLVQNSNVNSGSYFNDGSMQDYVENYVAVGESLAANGYENGIVVSIDKNGVISFPVMG